MWAVVLYAGPLLAVIDAMTRRLPTPIVGVAVFTVGGFFAGHAIATGQARTLVAAVVAAGAFGGTYLLLAVVGGSGIRLVSGWRRCSACLWASSTGIAHPGYPSDDLRSGRVLDRDFAHRATIQFLCVDCLTGTSSPVRTRSR